MSMSIDQKSINGYRTDKKCGTLLGISESIQSSNHQVFLPFFDYLKSRSIRRFPRLCAAIRALHSGASIARGNWSLNRFRDGWLNVDDETAAAAAAA